MIPTEHEYTAATHAAARKLYDMSMRGVVLTAGEKTAGVPDWDDVPLARKREYLETVLPIVDAAISAIPDRAQAARDLATRELDEEETRGLVMSLLPDADQITTEAQAQSVLEWVDLLLASRRAE